MGNLNVEIERKYYDNGSLEKEYETVNGKSHGYYRQYHQNGQLQVELIFENGRQKPGIVESYHPNGQLARRVCLDKLLFCNGEFEEFFLSGKIKVRGFYLTDDRFEQEVYYENGVLKKKVEFDEGKIISCVHRTVENELVEMLYLSENGITVKAKTGRNGAKAGEHYELNGEVYYVAAEHELHALVRNPRRRSVPLNRVVTTKVTSMYSLFSGLEDFNEDISNWDTSRVRNMNKAFYMCKAFNQPIGAWDLTRVRKTTNMFFGCSSFNQPIGNWDMSSLEVMDSMFEGATAFNQPIENWDVSSVTNMRAAFKGATLFNQPLGNWKIGHTKKTSWWRSYPWMLSLFEDAKSFNSSLKGWRLGGPISSMFKGAINFNQPLDSWDVSEVTSMKSSFENAESFNQDLSNWDTGEVTTFESMFSGASLFNGNIGTWNLKNAVNLTNMFRGAETFNQDISKWNVSLVTKMNSIFREAKAFSQNLSVWNVNDALKYSKTYFQNATSFDEETCSPFAKKEKPKRVIQTNRAAEALGITLTKRDKTVISKIKRLLKIRDLDQIDLGVELLRSIGDVKTYEILLHGCFIKEEKDEYDGKLYPLLTRNNFFSGTGPAQPFLDYALLNLIVDVPAQAKVDQSISKAGLKHLDIVIFNLDFGYETNFDRFVSLGNLTNLVQLNVYLGRLRKWGDRGSATGKTVDFNQVFKGSKIEKLQVSGFAGPFSWLLELNRLKSLSLDIDSFNPYSFDETFPELNNLIELEIFPGASTVSFMEKLKNLERLKIYIPDSAFIQPESLGLNPLSFKYDEKWIEFFYKAELTSEWKSTFRKIGALKNLKSLTIECDRRLLDSSVPLLSGLKNLEFIRIPVNDDSILEPFTK